MQRAVRQRAPTDAERAPQPPPEAAAWPWAVESLHAALFVSGQAVENHEGCRHCFFFNSVYHIQGRMKMTLPPSPAATTDRPEERAEQAPARRPVRTVDRGGRQAPGRYHAPIFQ